MFIEKKLKYEEKYPPKETDRWQIRAKPKKLE